MTRVSDGLNVADWQGMVLSRWRSHDGAANHTNKQSSQMSSYMNTRHQLVGTSRWNHSVFVCSKKTFKIQLFLQVAIQKTNY